MKKIVLLMVAALCAAPVCAQESEAVSIIDVPDLWIWSSMTLIMNGQTTGVPEDFNPTPTTIVPVVQRALKASGKACNAVTAITVPNRDPRVFDIVCDNGRYKVSGAGKVEG
ncbi:hypothetical protein [Rhizobium sp. BR 315]|uniref:hypothetical protein n=1 Tax=Rhizobium sp. BR 315 TaxID=3040014 RepID=UPI003D34E8EB